MAELNQEKIVQAIQLVADGVPLKQAADEVGLAYNSLRNKLYEEYRERNACNIAHLAAIYFRLGLIH